MREDLNRTPQSEAVLGSCRKCAETTDLVDIPFTNFNKSFTAPTKLKEGEDFINCIQIQI